MPKTAAKPASAAPPGFARTVRPSPELAAIVGAEPLTRAQATSKLWTHIKAHGLQDPADRRQIVADDKLRPIIGERIGMFELPGRLSSHLTAA